MISSSVIIVATSVVCRIQIHQSGAEVRVLVRREPGRDLRARRSPDSPTHLHEPRDRSGRPATAAATSRASRRRPRASWPKPPRSTSLARASAPSESVPSNVLCPTKTITPTGGRSGSAAVFANASSTADSSDRSALITRRVGEPNLAANSSAIAFVSGSWLRHQPAAGRWRRCRLADSRLGSKSPPTRCQRPSAPTATVPFGVVSAVGRCR